MPDAHATWREEKHIVNPLTPIRPARRGRLLAPLVAALVAVSSSLSAAAVAGPPPAAPLSPLSPVARSVRVTAPAPLRLPRAGLVVGRGDGGGWHLFVTSAAAKWRWRALASLLPFAAGGQRWIGDQCLTGDGRYVVAVIAPWAAQNTAQGRDAGGRAYAVEVATGRVRPLAAAVGLTYFNPGCGTGDTVALTGYDGPDEAVTRLMLADARAGRMRWRATIPGEFTSAVPAAGAIVAVGRGALLRIVPGRDGRERATPLPHAAGPAYDLRPNAVGGVDFLIPGGGGRVTIWRAGPDRMSALGSGHSASVALAQGVGGRTMVVGAAHLRAGGPLPLVPAVGTPAVSPDGRALVVGEDPSSTRLWLPGPGRTVISALPAAAPVAPAGDGPAPTPVADAATPACAVPRDNLSRQVLQPNAPQIQWAVQQAVRGWLTAPRSGGAYEVADYAPSRDFPSIPLRGGSTSDAVPPQVLYGIFAQESNWAQASWHALPGIAGDPLIANYYGDDPTTAESIDYTRADCGYGIGQLTDLMRLGPSGVATPRQVRVAVDFAENAAAAAQALATKWNQLADAKITANGGDPQWLEDWYLAIWAYNSGLHPATGAGPWGLGWANNPINPVYDPNRQPFLRFSYTDASHPQDWPYQEKVFGWMETPLLDLHSAPSYPTAGRLLLPPTVTSFCDPTDNQCDPTYKPGGDKNAWFCRRGDLRCWWHAPVTWADCASGACHPRSFTITDRATAEPATIDPHPPVCGPDPTAPAGTIVVDDEATVAGAPDLNLAGCPLTPSGWGNGGTFATAGVTDGAGHDLIGAIDWHQLGAGFGGHLWFTHTRPVSDITRTVTGTWTPTLSRVGSYEIRAFIPDTGAATTQARYIISDGVGTPWVRHLDQSQPGDQWVSLGFWRLAPGASVSLSDVTADGNGTVDIAFNAVEFIPVAPDSYVSLGDSYSAGEGTWPWPFDNGTDIAANSLDNGDLCHRSVEAYGRQYAALTTTFATQPVVHLACSGADLYDVTGAVGISPNPDYAGNAYYGEPYQIDEIPPDARLVTLSVGGNDIGFADVIQNCITAVLTATTCQAEYTNPDGSDKEAQLIDTQYSNLVTTYQAVERAAPQAQVWVLTYPNILTTDPTYGPGQADCTHIQNSDRAWLMARTHQLDGVIKKAAAAAGVKVLDEEHAFAGHEECTADTWVTPPLIPWPNNDVLDSAFHPNYNGYKQEAQDLKNAVSIP